MRLVLFTLLLSVLPVAVFAQSAGSACTASGSSVEVNSGTSYTRLVCDGSVYVETARWDSTGYQQVKLGAPAGFNPLTTTCNSTNEGWMVYRKSNKTVLICTGSYWAAVGGLL